MNCKCGKELKEVEIAVGIEYITDNAGDIHKAKKLVNYDGVEDISEVVGPSHDVYEYTGSLYWPGDCRLNNKCERCDNRADGVDSETGEDLCLLCIQAKWIEQGHIQLQE
jgi:7-cyano-7-deazaguanine synthase in queuosine biosynthesis